MLWTPQAADAAEFFARGLNVSEILNIGFDDFFVRRQLIGRHIK